MQTTTNYGLKTYQSSDLFNPLIVENANMETLDTGLKAISDRSIGRATELVSSGVHAITLIDTDCVTFKFVATGNFTEGETFTLNGITINANYPDGTPLKTDAFKTGAVVMASRNADDSVLTFYLSSVGGVAPDSAKLGGEIPAYYATKSYADGIKSTADNASTLIQKKALVNVYYDSSSQKLYKVNADGTQGGEIVMSRELDFANAVELAGTNAGAISYTTAKAGALIGKARSNSTTQGHVTLDGINTFSVPSSSSGWNDIQFTCIQNIGAGTVISSSVSCGTDTNYKLHFVPYK